MIGLILGVLSVAATALAVAKCAIDIAKDLGLIKKETQIEELGDRALRAEQDGIVPEKFEKYEEYVKAIENYKIEPDDKREFSEEDKIKKAAELTTKLLDEKFGENIGVGEFILQEVPKNEKFYIPERVKSYIETFEKHNESLDNVKKYFEKDIDGNDNIIKIDGVIKEAEYKLNPNLDSKEIDKIIDEQRID